MGPLRFGGEAIVGLVRGPALVAWSAAAVLPLAAVAVARRVVEPALRR